MGNLVLCSRIDWWDALSEDREHKVKGLVLRFTRRMIFERGRMIFFLR